MENKHLIKRILEICLKYQISHLGSYLTSVGIINEIYTKKQEQDIFILSSGHCAVALYAVLEKFLGLDAEKLFEKHGGHPHWSEEDKIYCSTGSLGMGITVAVGRALANPDQTVYCLISDGESAEGSVWEALRFIKEKNISNLKIYVNINGYSAYDSIDTKYLTNRLVAFLPEIELRFTNSNFFPFLCGLNAHYHVIKRHDFDEAIKIMDSTK